jgi:hypothetical protein
MEEKYAILLMNLFGTFVLVLYFVFIISAFTNNDEADYEFQVRISSVLSFMKEHKVEHFSEKRALNFYKGVYQLRKGRENGDLFRDVPLCLKADIALFSSYEVLRNVRVPLDVVPNMFKQSLV